MRHSYESTGLNLEIDNDYIGRERGGRQGGLLSSQVESWTEEEEEEEEDYRYWRGVWGGGGGGGGGGEG